MKRSKFTCCLLQSASYLWLQVLIACFPGKPQTIAPNLGPAEAAESNVGQTLSQDSMSDGNLVHIDLGVAKGSQEPKPLLALVAAIDEVEYQLTGCISGKTKTWVAGPGASLDLYKFDQLCRISLKRLRIVSVDYSMPAGISFNSSLNAVNAMQSSTGKIIYVKVQNQLPDILLANNYSSSFIINETNGGLDEAVPIYQVGISVNQTQIAEGAGQTATFTVQRGVPAIGSLTVNLAVSGTALPGLDTSAIPTTVTLANGQSLVTFTVTAVDDALPETLETMTIGIAAGAYFPLAPPASLNIKDNDVALLSFSVSTVSFGSRALNLPSAIAVTLTNSGLASASNLQLNSGLAGPFYFPTGYPGEGGSCGNWLAAAQSCTLVFGYNPSALIASSNALIFGFYDGVDPQTLLLNLQGSGANAGYPVMQIGPRFDFGVQTTGTSVIKHIVVNNLGSGVISALSGSFSTLRFAYSGGVFPGAGGNCTSTLAAASSCNIVIAFNPDATGIFTGSFTLNFNNGTQLLTTKVDLEGSASHLVATSEVLTTGLNQSLALTLKSTGAIGAVTYSLVQSTVFGTLSWTPPNLTYTPSANFRKRDFFTFRATDSLGPSISAEIQIAVEPKSIFLVANPAVLNTMDTQFKTQLQSLGFAVTLVDDGASNTSQAIGQDMVGVSASVSPASVLTKYRDVRLPTVIWEKALYDDMKMVASSTQTGITGNVSTINVVNNSNSITQGLALGTQTVLSAAAKINYFLNNDANLIKLATVVGNTAQTVLGGYEADAWMPGSMAAPARRLATFFPNSNGSFTATGISLMTKSIQWSMQNSNNLFYDGLQRDASTMLGNGWQENESSAGALSLSGQQLQLQTNDTVSWASHRFALQKSGVISLNLYLDLVRNGSTSPDYEVALQLGRCDLMDRVSSNESGVAVNILWGGVAAGMASEAALGYRTSNGTTVTLGALNSTNSYVSAEVDFSTNSYKITSPLGTSAAILMQNAVAIDCVRILSKNVSSTAFSKSGIHHLRVFQGN